MSEAGLAVGRSPSGRTVRRTSRPVSLRPRALDERPGGGRGWWAVRVMGTAVPVFAVGGPPAVGPAAGARGGGGPVTRGHVFVVHGDLTQLACDDVIVPAGSGFEVSPHWRALVPARPEPGSLDLVGRSGGSRRGGRLHTGGGGWVLPTRSGGRAGGARDGARGHGGAAPGPGPRTG